MASEGGWIARPLHGVAYVLRTAAWVLGAAADLVERAVGAPAPDAVPAGGDAGAADLPAPGGGTRERIAATLQRARQQYDVATAPPPRPVGAGMSATLGPGTRRTRGR